MVFLVSFYFLFFIDTISMLAQGLFFVKYVSVKEKYDHKSRMLLLAVEHGNKLNTQQSVAEVMSGLRRFNGVLASIMNVEYAIHRKG